MHALVLQAGQQSVHVLLTLRTNSENKKPHLFRTEKDLCKKTSHQAATPRFPMPGRGIPGTRLDKVHRNKPSLRASRELALLRAATPPHCSRRVAEQHGGGLQPGRESPPMPTEKGVSRLLASVTEPNPLPGPSTDTPTHEGSNPVYLSLHLRVNPQSGSHLSSSGELKHSRRLHRKSPCRSARVTFSVKAVKTTTVPVSKSLQ